MLETNFAFNFGWWSCKLPEGGGPTSRPIRSGPPPLLEENESIEVGPPHFYPEGKVKENEQMFFDAKSKHEVFMNNFEPGWTI